MVKLVGAAIVILGATLYGMKKYSDISMRKKFLEELFDDAAKIKNSLQCACLPLHECFLSGGEFFKTAASKIKTGELPSQAIEDSLQAYPILKIRDKECLRRFANGLGAGDCNGQIANLDIFINDVGKILKEAEDELNIKGKLYIKGSILSAAAIVLLLI